MATTRYLSTGKGNDTIRLGQGADFVYIEKTGGRIEISMMFESGNKPKRIVYEGKWNGSIENEKLIDVIRATSSQFDVLSLRGHDPRWSNSKENNAILLVEEGTTIDEYMEELGNIGIADDYDIPTTRHQIQFRYIERFELSTHTN